ncbi:MAG: lipopolysaccharide kinase InaA family protein [Gemmatimonadaceae bacterium]
MIPSGYVEAQMGHAAVVARAFLLEAIREALMDSGAGGTLYDYASHHPEARPLAGRGVAYAVPLPGGAANVVVRRSRHGGLLAPVTGESFLGSTRAPHELEVSLQLDAAGIPTPQVLAYAMYPSSRMFRRSDVLTQEIEDSRDLATAMLDAPDGESRTAMLASTGRLLAQLTAAGVRHPDLNLKNILLAPDDEGGGGVFAMLLDVDRVWFDDPGSDRVTDANLRRFLRSARKLNRRTGGGLSLNESDLECLLSAMGEQGLE